MNAVFAELPVQFGRALMSSIGKITPSVNDQEVSNMMYVDRGVHASDGFLISSRTWGDILECTQSITMMCVLL